MELSFCDHDRVTIETLSLSYLKIAMINFIFWKFLFWHL